MCQSRPLSLLAKSNVASAAKVLQQAAHLHTGSVGQAARATTISHHERMHSSQVEQQQQQPQQPHQPHQHPFHDSHQLQHQMIAQMGASAAMAMEAPHHASPLSELHIVSIPEAKAQSKPFVPSTVSLNDDVEEESQEIVPGQKPSKVKMFKSLMREYGSTFAVCYGVAWVSNFAAIYAAMGCAHFDGIALLQHTGIENLIHMDLHSVPPEAVTGLVAMELTEQLDLVRLPLLFKATPAVAQWWRNKNNRNQQAEEENSHNHS